MAKPRVLITTFYLKPGGEIDRHLQAADMEPVFKSQRGGRTEEDIIDLLQGIDGAIVGNDPFTARVLNAADRLKVVARTGVGYDTVDVAAASARGIAVCSNPGINRHAVAEYAFALMLQCSRRVMENMMDLRKGAWSAFPGRELAGKTLGIVGLGTIGKEVTQRARAFEMRVLAYDVAQDLQFAEEHQVSYVSLDQLLRESDFVTLHAFLNAKSRHLINSERLALMKPTAYLINTARGGLVDSEALCQAVRQGRIAGAALDVFEEEPLRADSPLREVKNVFLSPHAAGSSLDVRDASAMMSAENVIRVLKGERPLHIVNPEVLTS